MIAKLSVLQYCFECYPRKFQCFGGGHFYLHIIFKACTYALLKQITSMHDNFFFLAILRHLMRLPLLVAVYLIYVAKVGGNREIVHSIH